MSDNPTAKLFAAIPSDGEPLPPGRVAEVAALLDAGADPNALAPVPNNGTATPLMAAAWGGHAPLVRLLLDRGADPDRGNPAPEPWHRERPIETAADHGHTAAVEALIDGGAAYDLSHLVKVGLTARAEAYLERDPAAVSERGVEGATPLHDAVAHPDLVSLLLSRGAALDAVDDRGRTALLRAIEEGHARTATLLLERGAATDLFTAAGLGLVAEVERRLLTRDGQAALVTQADGATPLFHAVISGVSEVSARLLDAGADPSPRCERFWAALTPLHLALQRGELAIARLLVNAGADLDAQGPPGGRWLPPPLHVAARWRRPDTVAWLLDAGAMLEEGPYSALAWAEYVGDEPMITLLRERGAVSSSQTPGP